MLVSIDICNSRVQIFVRSQIFFTDTTISSQRDDRMKKFLNGIESRSGRIAGEISAMEELRASEDKVGCVKLLLGGDSHAEKN